MILLLGDIHGNAGVLREAINKAEMVGDVTAIIQVGDFGLYPENEHYFKSVVEKSTIPVYFIEGNHDDCDRWLQYTTISRIWDDANLFYIPRGTVVQMDNQTLAFMGGASSINKKWILRDGGYWTPLEDIRHEDIQNLIQNMEGMKVDAFITHIPPHSVIEQHFDNTAKILFEVGPEWNDINGTIVEDLWNKMGNPTIYSGHMHKRVVGQNYRILDINELLAI